MSLSRREGGDIQCVDSPLTVTLLSSVYIYACNRRYFATRHFGVADINTAHQIDGIAIYL